MSVVKKAKKFASYFLSFICVLSAFFGIFSGEAQAAVTEYEAHVAIFSDNLELAEQYVQLLHAYEYDGELKILGAPGSGKSTDKTVIMDGGSRKYNVYFHVIDASRVLHPDRELNDLIKCCTGAVILYDVMDPRLDPMLKPPTFYKEELDPFLSIDTPLNNCVKYLQSFGRYGWWNALNFIMYNSENLTPEEHEERRSQLNWYTLYGLEAHYVDGDNKWSRNHPVWNSPGGINNVLGWISGQIFRSVFDEKFLTGTPGKVLKKNWFSRALQHAPQFVQNWFGAEPPRSTVTSQTDPVAEEQIEATPCVPYRYVGW